MASSSVTVALSVASGSRAAPSGSGVTVKELAASFEAISGDALKVQEGPSRPGDVAGVYTVSSKAKDVLGWEAKLTEQEAVRDAIAWLPVRKEMLGY